MRRQFDPNDANSLFKTVPIQTTLQWFLLALTAFAAIDYFLLHLR